ncbi:ABC transporter permease [Devosia sp. YIM 151766]|uniref:ABC transporter permease n=1 Tax=Devosia sp. YIM 151766 TaxID=3017325 RepID=UPI00255C5AB0|nr:ABC transporter permease [Devosia sp. YIM 151766]WIY54576.1 ABC transporter permease [Devosia sp. YIM 151766]
MRSILAGLAEFALTLIVISIVILAVLVPVALLRSEPMQVLQLFILGPFGSMRHIGNILEAATPTMLTGLSAAVIFRAGSFNLGVEGSFFVGGISATAAALLLPLTGFIAAPTAIVIGALVGSLACVVPGYLRVRFGASEMVNSLVLNFAFLYAGIFVLNYFLRDPNAGALASYRLPSDFTLERLMQGTRLHTGVIVAFIACLVGGIWLYATRSGLNVRIVGAGPGMAQHLGLSASGLVMRAQIIGGLVAGMAGAIEVLGLYNRFTWTSLPGHGWTGITVAILARENPFLVIPAALFLAYLQVGGDSLARNLDVPSEVVGLVTAAIMLVATATAIFRHPAFLRLIRDIKGQEQAA